MARQGPHSPLQGRKPEVSDAEADEGSQVGLADATDGVDVRAGAVVLGQVAQEAATDGARAQSPATQAARSSASFRDRGVRGA